MKDLKEGASRFNGTVLTAEEAGFDGDFIEAQAFGYLAVRAVNNLPLSFPSTTGCAEPVSGGKVALP